MMKQNNLDKFNTAYDAKSVEQNVYKRWEESGFFNPDNLPPRHQKPFSIIMPPPNANGSLHAGHAVFVTLEDIMVRFKRMQGYKALWLPGADHAGFETQVVYEKKLEKEGRSRFQMDREELYQEILAFTLHNKKNMENELRMLGASCDWSREKFTLDPDIIRVVYRTFKKLYDDKLVYRGERIVNWCTKHQTSLSDIETTRVEQTDPLYFIKYGPIELATVRLETKFGDTAVAVNPHDPRYQQYIGKEIEIETILGPAKIKVIADEAVDMEFGTGAVKVTPAHDPADFEMWQRHKEEIPGPKEVIDQFGKLNEHTGPYKGMKVAEARKKLADDMAAKGLLDPAKTDAVYKHNVITCYKCGTILEPRIMPQWFVKTKPLAERAMQAVREGKTDFVSERFEKVFFHWLENIRDWNISRQIVWGIPIPAKICVRCGEAIADIDDTVTACPACTGPMQKDTDTFDTWFSSGQWPFAALGYPDSKDFRTFYPTDVMETGSDIVFFWVARMMMLGLYVTDHVPFRHIYLHGLVRAHDRQKMSKSKGNVISPITIAEKYGTDALRMALIFGATPGTDIILSEDKIRGHKHFANKIWNASRFILTNTQDLSRENLPEFTGDDQKTADEMRALLQDVTQEMEVYRFYMAAGKLYQYFWHTFADKIIEDAKKRISGTDEKAKRSAQRLLLEILTAMLKALHPFMPFITEEIWASVPGSEKPLIIEQWPS